MAWVELIDKRTKRNKIFQDDLDNNRKAEFAGICSLHYESVLDSNNFDLENDLSPTRVDSAIFDGWRIEKAGYHYALGRDLENHGTEDGWVGFGGRKGSNWFKYRLERVGYLHAPSLTYQDIGGAITYARNDLSQEIINIPCGDTEHSINIQSNITWGDLWSTPAGGEISAKWIVSSDKLKEHIVINQAARNYISSNEPPLTPINETYFGFIFELDWSDIPKIIIDNIQQDPNFDFNVDDLNIELKDSLDRLLGLMTISDCWVDTDSDQTYRLTKRFYNDNGRHYLLVGIRVDTLLTLPNGNLIFDPTINPAVGASADDGGEYSNGTVQINGTADRLGGGTYIYTFMRFLLTGPISGDTVNTAYLTIYAANAARDDPDALIDAENVDNSAAISYGTGTYEISSKSLTGNNVDWTVTGTGTGYVNTPSLVTPAQAVLNRGGWSSGNYMGWVLDDSDNDGDFQYRCYDYGSDMPLFYLEYTSSSGLDELTGTEIASGTSVDSATITENQHLTGTEIASGTSVDSAAITENQHLTGTEIASNTSVDEGTLTENQHLTGTEIASNTSVDEGTLTENQHLTGTEIASNTSVDSAIISEAILIEGTEISAATSVDNSTITENQHLIGTEISSGTSVDSATISENQHLTGTEISAATSVDSALISESGIDALQGTEISSITSVDEGSISEHHYLTGTEISATTSVDSAMISEQGTDALIGTEISSNTSVDEGTLTENQHLIGTEISATTSVDSAIIAETTNIVGGEISVQTIIDSAQMSQHQYLQGNEIFAGTSVDYGSLILVILEVPEDRIYYILGEDRIIFIENEDRIIFIENEDRTEKI